MLLLFLKFLLLARSVCLASKAGRQHRLPHNDTHPHEIIKSAHFPRIGAFSPLRHRMQLEQMIEKVLCIENNNMAFVAALPLQAICCVSKRAFFIIILYTPAFAPLSLGADAVFLLLMFLFSCYTYFCTLLSPTPKKLLHSSHDSAYCRENKNSYRS